MNNIITAAEVRGGDKLKVILKASDRLEYYVGVANHFNMVDDKPRWRTPGNNALFTDHADEIELLDRPVPKIELPTGEGAAFEYQRLHTTACRPLRRVATLSDGVWRVVGEAPTVGEGLQRTIPYSNTPEYMTWLLNDGCSTSNYKVLFEGVAK